MKLGRYILVLVLLSILSGCSSMNKVFKKKKAIDPTQMQHELELISSHLELMRNIASDDYPLQVQLHENTLNSLQNNESDRNKLRYALVLITSGHPNTDVGRGYSELQSIIAEPGDLSPLEINLADVMLNEIESIMILEARNAELSSVVDQAQSQIDKTGRSSQVSLSQAQKRLRDAQYEINTLKSELDEARAKLDALKNIEVTTE